jgi:hypothetical protein
MKPGSSPFGDASTVPSGPTVLITAKGLTRKNSAPCASTLGNIFAKVVGRAGPRRSRKASTVSIRDIACAPVDTLDGMVVHRANGFPVRSRVIRS